MLLVEDHPLLAESLKVALKAEGMPVDLAPLDSAAAVLDMAQRVRPDVVLLDLELGEPIRDGLSLVSPLGALGATIIVVSATASTSRMGACLVAGAAGFVAKSRPLDELVAAVRDAWHGRSLLGGEERRHLIETWQVDAVHHRGLMSLTPREQAVLQSLIEGKAAATVAKDAYVSEGTVRTQIRSILTKLGVSSQLGAVAVAHKAGWRGPSS